jgi:hypothetical protein
MKRLLRPLIGIILTFTTACASISGIGGDNPSSLPAPQTSGPDRAAAEPAVPGSVPVASRPTGEVPPMASLDDERFDLQLTQAVESLDFEAMRSLMRERFAVAIWNTELREYSAEEAIQWLGQFILTPGSTPAVKFGTDLVALLEGSDPSSLWGPAASPVRGMHVTGLGENAANQAILVIGRDEAAEQLYWHGILVPVSGLFQTFPPIPGDFPVDEGTQVMAKQVLDIRFGPGTQYPVIGHIAAGKIAQVTGKSANGSWWKINCTYELTSSCYISCDPSLAEITSGP